MNNKDNNQGVTETPSYIIIKVEYNIKLIMPIKKGMEFMEAWASATTIREEYQKPVAFEKVDKDFEVRFISEERFKEMQMAATIAVAPEDD